ncbi:MAG TPA: Ricin and poly(3-hydroxybutyrate) depolymerase fusion [Polyangiaceae bacterium]
MKTLHGTPSTRAAIPLLAALAFSFGCAVEDEEPPDGSGGQAPATGGAGVSGVAGSSGASPSGNGGTAGRGGSTGAGSGGTQAGGGGSAGAASGGGGAPAGSGGNTNPAGGSSSGSAGTGGGQSGGTGPGGNAGSGPAGSGGAGAGGGSSGSGNAGTGGAMPSAGCGKAAPASDRYTIDVDGEMREYILAVPDDYDPEQPYRLIFGWHPLGGSADQVANGGYYGLERESEGSAIFVAAEGLPFQGNSLGWANTNGRDLAFLDAMMERFRSELCIDEDRIFSTGFSFGGMMSFAVGCAENSVMRAIAPQAGNIQVSGCENGTQPVAVMGFHGDDDTVVSIDGGRAGRDKFIERNQCSEQTEPLEPSWCDGLQSSNEPCNCVNYQGCSEGYPVIWCEFNGPHTPAPNSGATIWNFFAQF